MDRTKLPYRKNCEGYFFFKNKVLAQDTKKGYILFPGGGFNDKEKSEAAILRETFEETGAVIKNLKKIKTIWFDWAPDWARTEKQKERYKHYLGEKMYLFTGEIEELKDAPGDPENNDPGWEGEKLMKVEEVVKLINSNKPFPKNMEEYYSIQLRVLMERLKK